jgi:hypothetical protein
METTRAYLDKLTYEIKNPKQIKSKHALRHRIFQNNN